MQIEFASGRSRVIVFVYVFVNLVIGYLMSLFALWIECVCYFYGILICKKNLESIVQHNTETHTFLSPEPPS